MASLPKLVKARVAIKNVRVFDGHGFGEPSTITIDGGVIVGDGDGAEEVDCHGGFLLPGFIDAHIHLQDENDLRQMAKYGITTGLDMATWPASKLKALRGRSGLTDIRSPGVPATCEGSMHSRILPIPKEVLVSGPDDAKQFVANRVSEGADYIKIIADVPGPNQETLNALVTAAHEQNLLVIAHASAYTPFSMALEARADVLTHAPLDKPVDDKIVKGMVAENRVSVPTLTMMEALMKPPSFGALFLLLLRPSIFWAIIRARRENPNRQGRKYEHARESVTAMYRAGVPILAGTDSHSGPGSPLKVLHGDSFHHELELLVDAGLSTADALQAGTSLPAKHFRLDDRGVIEVGKRADLVLLADNPLLDIRATRSIRRVWCGGTEVDRS